MPEFIELTEADRQTPLDAELASAQEAFRSRLGDDPAGALVLAKRIVALTSEAYGESHDHVSRALTNLAIVQAENANFDAAVENYIAAIPTRPVTCRTPFSACARQSDDNPDQFLDALEQRAAWHGRLENYDEAMRAYRRVVRTVSDQYGKNDVRLIEPLVALAYAAARVPGRRLTGKRAIGRAVQTAREHAEGSPELLARTLVEEGDWYASQSAKRRFRRPYGEGWDILDEDPALQPVRDALFAAPTRLSLPLLCTIYGLRMDETASPELYPDSGYIDAVFDVDENGRPVNVRIVDASPSGLMNVHVRYQIGRFRYRPACGNGRPRPFTGLSYRHEFRYYASSLTEQERDLIATTTNGTDAAPERASPGDGEPSP